MVGGGVVGLASRLAEEADVGDGHGLVDGLAHVVDGEGGDADGGQGLHLDAGLGVDGGGGVDADLAVVGRGGGEGGDVEVDGDRVGGEAVAERDEVGGAFGGHDAGDTGDGQDLPLGDALLADARRVAGDIVT